MIAHGGVAIVYDGDGNRVSETVGTVTTNYLVDTVNPTGYAQVVDELQGGNVTRTYSYGLERISETQPLNSVLTTSFYGYDGHGSVRQLTNSAGVVTDTYDYDAFGNLINQTGTTPNNYLFAGEQYDPALGLYFNRARYLNTATGRFWSMDTVDGDDEEPASLHKYTYAEDNPVDNTDRSGNEIDEIAVAAAISVTLDAMPSVAQAGAAVTRQARFAALLHSYPSHADHSSDPKQPGNIWALIGGHVQMNAYNKGVVNNTCAIRMSYALNLSGWAIPKGSGTVSGADGSQYYLRVADLQGFLSTLFPKQTLPGGSFSGPSGVTGIISFNIPFGRNPVTGDRAGGHFALWTGQGLNDATESDYASWPAPTSTLFWRVN